MIKTAKRQLFSWVIPMKTLLSAVFSPGLAVTLDPLSSCANSSHNSFCTFLWQSLNVRPLVLNIYHGFCMAYNVFTLGPQGISSRSRENEAPLEAGMMVTDGKSKFYRFSSSL